MSKKTDLGKIEYPKGTSAGNRRLCRSIINEVSDYVSNYDVVVVACSGGVDSTVLVHAVSQALIIQPYSKSGKEIQSTAVYVNHNFRPNEVQKEIEHVENISYKYMSFSTEHIELNLSHVKSNIQAQARKSRYNALNEYCTYLHSEKGDKVALLTAHHANDVAETRLFQFIKGKVVGGIHSVIPKNYGAIVRPMLKFSRDDIELYAKTFKLSWCEDSSNKKNDYARNFIRNELIPVIEKELNPGVIKCLSREVA